MTAAHEQETRFALGVRYASENGDGFKHDARYRLICHCKLLEFNLFLAF
jgi:hypothetical protein